MWTTMTSTLPGNALPGHYNHSSLASHSSKAKEQNHAASTQPKLPVSANDKALPKQRHELTMAVNERAYEVFMAWKKNKEIEVLKHMPPCASYLSVSRKSFIETYYPIQQRNEAKFQTAFAPWLKHAKSNRIKENVRWHLFKSRRRQKQLDQMLEQYTNEVRQAGTNDDLHHQMMVDQLQEYFLYGGPTIYGFWRMHDIAMARRNSHNELVRLLSE